IQGADGFHGRDGNSIIGAPNAEGVDVSTNLAKLCTPGNTVTADDVVFLYAVKHNPFAYFASVQEGRERGLNLDQVVAFEGQHGLYADLKSGHVPDLAFIEPNQCNDQ